MCPRAGRASHQIGLAHAQRQLVQILVAEREGIEAKLHLVVMLARMQRVQVGDAVEDQASVTICKY